MQWHLLCTPLNPNPHGFPYAIDNGAWSQHGDVNDFRKFHTLVESLGVDAEFVVAPDIVAGGGASLKRSLEHLPVLLIKTKLVLIPVQDGLELQDLSNIVSARIGIFLGGTTEYKLSRMRDWGAFCKAKGVYYHVGRVNSGRRIKMCYYAGAHSFDGTSATMYSKTLPLLGRAVRRAYKDPFGILSV